MKIIAFNNKIIHKERFLKNYEKILNMEHSFFSDKNLKIIG